MNALSRERQGGDRLRYYRRMFRTFAGIAIIYTLLIEIVFLCFYWIPSRHEYETRVEATASQVSEFTDFRLQSLQEMGLMLNVSEYTKKYLGSYLTNYEKLKYFNFITGIYGLTPGSKHAIAITKYDDDYVIMNNSTGNIDSFQSEFYIGDETLDHVIKQFNENRSIPMQVLNVQDDQGNEMYVVARCEWIGNPKPIYIFSSYYKNQLFHVDAIQEGTLAVFYRNELVASAGQLDRQQIMAAMDNRKDSGLVFHTEPSNVTGFHYVYLAEPQQIFTPALMMLIASGLLAMGVSIGLMSLITKRMYTPIETVLQTTGDSFTAGDEFAHIKSTIETLHTDVETMAQSLEKYNVSLENKFVHDLLIGLIPPEAIAEGLGQYPKLRADGPFTVILLKFAETDPFEGTMANGGTYDVKLRLSAALGELFALKSFYRIVDLNSETQVVIVSTDDANPLSERLRNTIINVEPAFGHEIYAIIGPPCDRIEQLFTSYRKTIKLADTREYLNYNAKVIQADEVKPVWKGTVYFPLQEEQTLINAIIHCKTSVWQSTITEVIRTNKSERGSDQSQLAVMLDATVNRIIDGSNIHAEELFGPVKVTELHFRASRSYEELEHKALETFGLLASWFAKEQEKSNNGLSEKMLAYVEENYHNEISLFDLADYLNLSRNYVSTLFKNSTGRNFKDYLSEYRHKAACSILEQSPEKRLKEVAEMVGCNADMLSRLFVRYSGMLPSDYQQVARQQKKEQEL
jgi:Response regulator containing CheY-like receiver domain and AraC-type DNA-binding domain